VRLNFSHASTLGYLIFAGIMLVGPVWIHLLGRTEAEGRRGNLPGSLT